MGGSLDAAATDVDLQPFAAAYALVMGARRWGGLSAPCVAPGDKTLARFLTGCVT